MGQKVNPRIFRIGQSESWRSKWFATKDYAELLQQDYLIRKFIKNKLKSCSIDKIEIERSTKKIDINIHTAKPGLIIGRGGSGIEDLKKEINDKFLRKEDFLNINIHEVDNPNLSSEIVLQSMVVDIEKRIPFRRVMKQNIDRVMRAGALGVKISMSGRLNGVEIAREENLHQGRMPLHTIRANIDYARAAAFTTYGAVGIKVWIYKGEVFNKKEEKSGKRLSDLTANQLNKKSVKKDDKFNNKDKIN
jgi:small subunit ribosomal protein S3